MTEYNGDKFDTSNLKHILSHSVLRFVLDTLS